MHESTLRRYNYFSDVSKVDLGRFKWPTAFLCVLQASKTNISVIYEYVKLASWQIRPEGMIHMLCGEAPSC